MENQIQGVIEMAQYIEHILCSQFEVMASWGYHNPKAVLFFGKPSLMFSVNGFLHTGDVVISYNAGDDAFDVYLCKNNAVEKTITLVYLDELVRRIDEEVETKNPNSIAYQKQVYEFINNI